MIENRYQLQKTIGEGSFGSVSKAIDLTTNTKVAVKFELTNHHSQFHNEVKAYQSLSSIEGIPKLISVGRHQDKQYIIIELLGKSLEDYYQKKQRTFSLGCIISISMQLLKRLEDIHARSYIHRDIKPPNIVLGRNKANMILYLIDFGLSKKYRDPLTKQHTFYRENRQMIGNLKFSSMNSHLGIEQSRRDDLESWLYLMIFYINKALPWEFSSTEANDATIIKCMQRLTPENLCTGCPAQCIEMYKYIKQLRFEETPNYSYLRKLLTGIVNENNLSLQFDWLKKSHRRESNEGASINSKKSKTHRRASEQIMLGDSLKVATIFGSIDSINSKGAMEKSLSNSGSQNSKLSRHSKMSCEEIKEINELDEISDRVNIDEVSAVVNEISDAITERNSEYPEFLNRELIFKRKESNYLNLL